MESAKECVSLLIRDHLSVLGMDLENTPLLFQSTVISSWYKSSLEGQREYEGGAL